VSRFFAPGSGIPEDPVTGSAHTVLAPYWSARLGRDELVGLQGSARTGLVRTALHGDRVHLTGDAVTVMDGNLHVQLGDQPTAAGGLSRYARPSQEAVRTRRSRVRAWRASATSVLEGPSSSVSRLISSLTSRTASPGSPE